MAKNDGVQKKYILGLSKTRESFGGKIAALFNRKGEITDGFYEELEETLILADVGARATVDILDELQRRIRQKRIAQAQDARDELKEILVDMLRDKNGIEITFPCLLLIVGVNGAGKTTAIAKLASRYKAMGRSVMLAAGDTFRAAALEQLEEWAKRAGVPVVRHGEGADPAAVIFDAAHSAKAKNIDVLICDTAGRLHNKKHLMEELKKIERVAKREYPEACHRTLLVTDATTGQNAISQSEVFKQSVDVDGMILTKLDGTAKGGAAISIMRELGLPIVFISVGEGIDDLQEFDPEQFVEAII
ncbi:MAG: signal recognition particle-docking protein FtsY [Bacillota bacterium]|nr:signal recognition particle-docking protein FtsY [Bacillota bacterium]